MAEQTSRPLPRRGEFGATYFNRALSGMNPVTVWQTKVPDLRSMLRRTLQMEADFIETLNRMHIRWAHPNWWCCVMDSCTVRTLGMPRMEASLTRCETSNFRLSKMAERFGHGCMSRMPPPPLSWRSVGEILERTTSWITIPCR